MNRYNRILDKNPREIVLLKSRPCKWGRCFFCDYIDDNSNNIDEIIQFNKNVLNKVRGDLKVLEVINSASVFELPEETLLDIKDIVDSKNIHSLFFESHYMYREKLGDIKALYPNQKIIFKTGIESFDHDFRNKYLKKNVNFDSPKEVSKYFNSICLMVGIKGQTKDMIKKDIEILLDNFDHACINIYTENSTPVKADPELIKWFKSEYSHLEDYENIEILWNNTDFGVGD